MVTQIEPFFSYYLTSANTFKYLRLQLPELLHILWVCTNWQHIYKIFIVTIKMQIKINDADSGEASWLYSWINLVVDVYVK